MIKLWIDDRRPAPEGYIWCKSVNETIKYIQENEMEQNKLLKLALDHLKNYYMEFYRGTLHLINNRSIDLISLDHDAGDYASEGGDYIKLLDWLEATGRNYPIHIHSQNAVGVANMRRIIERNGWKEIK